MGKAGEVRDWHGGWALWVAGGGLRLSCVGRVSWGECAGWAGGAPRGERTRRCRPWTSLRSGAEQPVAMLTVFFYRQCLFCLSLDAYAIFLFVVSVQKFLDGDVWLFCCNYFLSCSLFNSNVTYIACTHFQSTAPGIFTFVYTCVTTTWPKC